MRNRLLAALILGAILGACSGKSPATAKSDSATAAASASSGFTLTAAQKARLQIVIVAPTLFQPSVDVTGTVAFNGDKSTQVLSPVSGPVTGLLVQVGTPVARGAALATVASADFASAVAAYRKAESAYRQLQRIADQDAQLFKTDAISRRDVEQAQTDAAAGAADRDAALQQMRSLGVDSRSIEQIRSNGAVQNIPAVIRSPITGTVVERLITPGQLLQAGSTPAFTVADLSTVWVLANVFEGDIATVHRGQLATVTSSVSQAPFTGTVDYVSALVDPTSRATSVRLVVRNRNDLLKRDMYVRVSIKSNINRSGILIPSSSVQRDDENLPFVFVEAANGSYGRQRVTLGAHVGDRYEVLAGLKGGERVVADGALFVQFAESQ
ncbi:MAG TPA: efflux RND transporter periplasmic adaptor subunit [Gemmatimonadaceae bacterium]